MRCCQICQRQTWHVAQNCHSAVFWHAQKEWIYGKLRGVGGKTDKKWGGLYLEILSVLWLSDRTVRCVRWLYIQVIFKESFTEPAARSCQAEEKCQSGFSFVCLFFASQWKFVCAAFGMKKSNFVCPWKYSQIHLRLPQLLGVQIGL